MVPVELLILGSGTSQGIPAIGCQCETCMSDDPRDKRLRPSALFRVAGKQFLVDPSSDFRQQMLTHNVNRIDAVLLTHHHFDHIGGFDDLRQYNFLQKSAIKMYGLAETLEEVRLVFRYAFGGAMQDGGGIPRVELFPLQAGEMMTVEEIPVLPILCMHGKLNVLGYRIGNIAYLTDTNFIPPESMSVLNGLDTLVLDALRHEPHPTHFSLDEAVEWARKIAARRTYFTHFAHNIKHARDQELLPKDMYFSYDSLVLESAKESK